jgi:tetratricopeptide (TPR) repeat protein
MLCVAPAARSQTECPSSYEFQPGAYNYNDPEVQPRIRAIEGNHMPESVIRLERGSKTINVGGEIRFILRNVPNHHVALGLALRLAQKVKSEHPVEMEPYAVECWLHRATVFAPSDGIPRLVYGIHLGRLGKVDAAIDELTRADELVPDNSNVTYNLGLMYLQKKDYERAREYAKRAYAMGFPLPGLRQKLTEAGHWRD